MEEKQKTQVPRVRLGSQGLEVSRLGFGCGSLSGILNSPLSFEDGCSVLKEAFSRGITFFDTADLYGKDHHNEILVGKALKELPRQQIQLATKFGVRMPGGKEVEIDGSPEYLRKCCEASLQRLDVDYIDLYYQQRIDPTVPIEDTMGELKKLVEEGKIKYIGLSEASIDTIKRAHAVHPITTVQMEYSLWSRDIEDGIIPLCRFKKKLQCQLSYKHVILGIAFLNSVMFRELGIGIVAYSPLGHGFFAGKAVVESLPSESLLSLHPRFTGENLERNKVMYRRYAELANKHGCTSPQLALAWLLHQGNDIVPIPGTTKVKNLGDNIRSLEVKLSSDDSKDIDDAVSIDEVSGDREYDIFSKYSWKYSVTPPKK